MEAHCASLDRTIDDLTADSLKSLFAHVYYVWRTFRPALGEELGVKLYGNVWAELARMSFAAAVEKLELEAVTDLPTLGLIVKECFIGVPSLYVIKRNDPHEHIGHILWCANPAYGPADNIFERHDYYRKEVFLTYVYLWALIEEAKKKGLEQEITVDMPAGRCRDGACAACQVILRTRDADPARHVPEVENRYIEQEMGAEEPVSFVLKEQGRTFEEQGPASFSGFFAVDFIAWLQLFTNDPGSADEIYRELWGHYRQSWLNEAKLALEIGKVTTAKEVADIVAYCQKKRYVAFASETDTAGVVKLTSSADPFVQVADMFNAPPEYKQAVVNMEQHFMDDLISDMKLQGRAEAPIVSHIANGDPQTEIDVVVH
jgi:hypothetical protein